MVVICAALNLTRSKLGVVEGLRAEGLVTGWGRLRDRKGQEEKGRGDKMKVKKKKKGFQKE